MEVWAKQGTPKVGPQSNIPISIQKTGFISFPPFLQFKHSKFHRENQKNEQKIQIFPVFYAVNRRPFRVRFGLKNSSSVGHYNKHICHEREGK
jgi:hypothetical protein